MPWQRMPGTDERDSSTKRSCKTFPICRDIRCMPAAPRSSSNPPTGSSPPCASCRRTSSTPMLSRPPSIPNQLQLRTLDLHDRDTEDTEKYKGQGDQFGNDCLPF